MNILLLTDDLFPGGVQRHVVDVANSLVQRGHNVSVAASAGLLRKRLHHSVEFIEAPLARIGRREPLGLLKALGILRGAMQGRKYDILHSHMRYADALGRILSFTFGVPHISTCHSLFNGGRWYSLFGKETIAVSQMVKKMLVESFGKSPESVAVLYNEIQPVKRISAKQRRETARKYDLQKARIVLFYVGRFTPEKGPVITLEALGVLKERGKLKGLKLLMVGYGELRETIVAEIKSHGLEQHVVLLPETTDIGEVLNIADFGILSSLREGGIPYIILEAASLGKPVVASATGGILEFVRDMETGKLFPPGDVVSLADAIQQLLENPADVRKLGRNARKSFLQSHVSNGSIEKTLAIYEKAIGQRRR